MPMRRAVPVIGGALGVLSLPARRADGHRKWRRITPE
jgi:hypothetical protein